MGLRIITATLALVAISRASPLQQGKAPRHGEFTPLDPRLQNCAKFDLTVSVNRIPKFDKKSNSDLFFQITRTDDKNNLYQSEIHREQPYGQTSLKFKPFTLAGDPQEEYKIGFWDKDKGFLNKDDWIADFFFTVQPTEREEGDIDRQVQDGSFCTAMFPDQDYATDKAFCKDMIGKFADEKMAPFMVLIHIECAEEN